MIKWLFWWKNGRRNTSCTFVPQFSCPFSPRLFSLLPLLYLPIPCTLPAFPHSSPFPISDHLQYMHANRRGALTSSFITLSSSLLFLLFSPSHAGYLYLMVLWRDDCRSSEYYKELHPLWDPSLCQGRCYHTYENWWLPWVAVALQNQVLCPVGNSCFLLLQYPLVLLRRFQANWSSWYLLGMLNRKESVLLFVCSSQSFSWLHHTFEFINHSRGSFYLYEDDGNTTEYMEGTFSNTSVSYIYSPDQWVEVYIVPVAWALIIYYFVYKCLFWSFIYHPAFSCRHKLQAVSYM